MLRGARERQAEDFYRREYPGLYRYALYLVSDEDTAREICQETFIRWFEQDDKCSVENPRAWLKKVLSHQAYSFFRYRKKNQGLKEKMLSEYIEDRTTMDDDILRIEVEEVLAGMKGRDQVLLKMRMAGMSYSEMAEALDVSMSSIGTLLARALKRFRAAYEEKGVGTYDEMYGRRKNLTVLGRST